MWNSKQAQRAAHTCCLTGTIFATGGLPYKKRSKLLIKKLILKTEIWNKMHGNKANVILAPLIRETQQTLEWLSCAHSDSLLATKKPQRFCVRRPCSHWSHHPDKLWWMQQGQSLNFSKQKENRVGLNSIKKSIYPSLNWFIYTSNLSHVYHVCVLD